MRNRSRFKEEGFLWVPGSEGMPIMAGKARQLEWVSLWPQELAMVAHAVVMIRKQRAENVILKGFLQRSLHQSCFLP